MMKASVILLVSLVWILAGCQATVRDREASLERISFQSKVDGTERDYFLYLPKGYSKTSAKKWPVLMFLHGNGERGNGKDELDFVLAHGPLYEAWIQKRDLPFIIISPQLPMFGLDKDPDHYINHRSPTQIPKRWSTGIEPRGPAEKMKGKLPLTSPIESMTNVPELLPRGWEMIEADLLDMLTRTHQELKTNQQQVYLSGLSYGGFGTWFMASQHPEKFAAIAPVAGWGHPNLMAPIAEKKLPVWAFAGGKDPVIGLAYFFPGINELEKLGHDNVAFTVHQNSGHDVWRRVYQSESLYRWLLTHELTTTQ